MPFKRITAEEISALGVVAAPDRLTGKAEDNKAIFDRLVRELVTVTYNGLLDALEAQTGAAELGAAPFDNVEGETVQAQLQSVQSNLELYQKAVGEAAGAALVGAEPFGALLGETVQRQLRELLTIHEALRNPDGAAYIGAEPFNGVPGKTVQEQLGNLKQNVDDINAGIIPQQSVTMEKLGQDVVERIEAPVVTFSSGELDDFAARIGVLTNAGAGWNSYRFPSPFEAPPVVVAQALEFSGWVEIKSVTAEGFLYCLRRSKLTPGTTSSATVYVGSAGGTQPSHRSQSVITSTTQPVLGSETVSAAVQIGYIALEFGGET